MILIFSGLNASRRAITVESAPLFFAFAVGVGEEKNDGQHDAPVGRAHAPAHDLVNANDKKGGSER